MMYHCYYFEGMSYLVTAQDLYTTADSAGKGMNMAAATFRVTLNNFEKARKIVSTIPSNYMENFNNKISEVSKMKTKSEEDNKKIYFEKDIPDGQVPKPDQQNFVKLESVEDQFEIKHPIGEKLRHIVPPAVRAMQEELRNLLQTVLNQEMEK